MALLSTSSPRVREIAHTHTTQISLTNTCAHTHTVKAFHLRFDDGRVDPNIQRWDVHLLQVCESHDTLYLQADSLSLRADQSEQEALGQAVSYEVLGDTGQVY